MFFYCKFRKKWQKFGNLHQTLKTTKVVKIGNFSLLLQIQENLPNSQNHKLWKNWKFLFFYCKFGKNWQKIEKTHQTLEIQSFVFLLSWLTLVVFGTFCHILHIKKLKEKFLVLIVSSWKKEKEKNRASFLRLFLEETSKLGALLIFEVVHTIELNDFIWKFDTWCDM